MTFIIEYKMVRHKRVERFSCDYQSQIINRYTNGGNKDAAAVRFERTFFRFGVERPIQLTETAMKMLTR